MSISRKKIYKICIVGDGGVGKTTILYQYVDGKFIENTQMTIGINFFVKDIFLKEFNTKIILQIWDLGGQEHFKSVRPSFYEGAVGIIYTYDLTRINTFTDLIEWKKEIDRVLNGKTPSILIGNKLDLIDSENRRIFPKDIQKLRKLIGFSNYFETSAKENVGINKLFNKITKDIYKVLNN
ncbi:MAG: Rab family GTPase [Candidatus Heimdallarchaeota archaeon]